MKNRDTNALSFHQLSEVDEVTIANDKIEID